MDYILVRDGTDSNFCIQVDGESYRLEVQHVAIDGQAWHSARIVEHQHDVYHIELFTKGSNYCSLNGEKIPVTRGTLIVTSPQEPHSFSVTEPGLCLIREVTFAFVSSSGEPLRIPFMEAMSVYFGLPLQGCKFPRQLPETAMTRIETALAQTLDTLQEGRRRCLLSLHLDIGRLFEIVVSECFLAPDDLPLANMDGRIERARRRIERDFNSNETIETLARRVLLSRSHFQREFKKLVGVTPAHYRLHLRIQSAKVLLEISNLQCRQIAQCVGLADEFHFSRTFKRLTGLSFPAYRDAIGDR